MGQICKDRWGVNMKTKRSLHIRPEWYTYIIQRRGWLILGPLLQRNDSVDLNTLHSSRRDRSNDSIFTARF